MRDSKTVPLPQEAGALSESKVASLFRANYRDKFLFCNTRGRWFKLVDGIWRPDETNLAFHYVRELADSLAEAAPNAAIRVGKAGFAGGVERFGRADPIFGRVAEDFDRDLWLLGVPGGMVDLKSGACLAAEPEKMISRSALVGPTDTADCPMWTAFLQDATDGNDGLIRFLQQWCGYCLTGEVIEHALVFVHGDGGNGKSVFINTVSAILGEYAMTANMDAFTASRHDKHPADLASFKGSRLIVASEVEEGKAWAEARLKGLTGGDKIQARFMRQDFFEYQPQFKLTIVGNHQPVLHTVDAAMKRRFNMIPFTHKPRQVDPLLEMKLRQEYPAILRWMIDGCLDWQENGLMRPAIVDEATSEYFDAQDVLSQWMSDECIVEKGNERCHEASSVLYASWKRYSGQHGEEAGTQKAFTSTLKARGFGQFRASHLRGITGIRLKPSERYPNDGL